MNLNNFEEQVNKTILERGINYFESGYITHLQKLNSGEWLADVEGNYGYYNINVKLDNKNNIDYFHCNCPYDGNICKHVLAVLLAIKQEQDFPETASTKYPPEWETILEVTSEKELRHFLLNYAKKNPAFQRELLLELGTFSDKINTEKYRLSIAQNFNTFTGRQGYIDYNNAYAAMSTVNNLLAKAQEHISKGNLHEAFSIVSAVAPECIEVLEGMDDSDGACGGAIDEAFEMAGEILMASQNTELAETIFDWLFEQIQNPDYNDYGCGDMLEPIFFDAINNNEQREKAHQLIDKQINIAKKQDTWSSKYRLTKYLKYKVDLLLNEGKLIEADQIIEENINLDVFRKMRINEALDKNNIELSIEHINKGISQAKKDDSLGIVQELKDQLLEIYIKENDAKNIRKFSKELFLKNQSSINYFRIYKGTFNPEEWTIPCMEIITVLSDKKQKNYLGYVFQSDLAAIFIEEAMWEKLFDEVKRSNNINIVEKYLRYLAPHYPDQLISLYRNAIIKFAENTGRDNYVTLVVYLKNLRGLKGGKNVAKELTNELLEKYKKRRAMKDEFKILKW
ncbi:MAG: SWIM zinc finger family protein [Salinivirgaceae bacterium]|nr:SWIM zinc finger family protein [Salinivirgaceae bacterium]